MKRSILFTLPRRKLAFGFKMKLAIVPKMQRRNAAKSNGGSVQSWRRFAKPKPQNSNASKRLKPEFSNKWRRATALKLKLKARPQRKPSFTPPSKRYVRPKQINGASSRG